MARGRGEGGDARVFRAAVFAVTGHGVCQVVDLIVGMFFDRCKVKASANRRDVDQIESTLLNRETVASTIRMEALV